MTNSTPNTGRSPISGPSRDNAAHRLALNLVRLSTPCPYCGHAITAIFFPLPSEVFLPCPRCRRSAPLNVVARRTSLGTLIELVSPLRPVPVTCRAISALAEPAGDICPAPSRKGE